MFRKSTSLIERLRMLLAVCFVPFLIVTVYLLAMVHEFSGRYDQIVDKITKANTYNIDFKETIDYTMYVVVVNSERAPEIADAKEAHQLLEEARKTFSLLSVQAREESAKSRLSVIIRCLDTLEESMEGLESDAQISGMYEKNMETLDLDIRILTELIQEQIQEYISYEATNLQALRREVRRDVERALWMSVLISGVTLMGALFLSRKISRSLTRGIHQLRNVTQKAGRGDFTVRACLEENDEEMAELEDGFNQMVERIGNLVEDIRLEQKNKRMTEQKLLQAQINPHFLYNTLDAIIWQAEAGEKEQVVEMVTALSDFFRTTLSKGRDYISVEEEESHIRSYLQIQRFRYQDILEYEIDIPAELYSCQILKLTLQPLVENALYHGIKNKRGMGRISVRGRLDGEEMVFTVSDNGVGMTPERLAQVCRAMNQEEEENPDPSVFGLFNVAQRIKLNYGPQYGVRLESSYGEGTEAEVILPAIKK